MLNWPEDLNISGYFAKTNQSMEGTRTMCMELKTIADGADKVIDTLNASSPVIQCMFKDAWRMWLMAKK